MAFSYVNCFAYEAPIATTADDHLFIDLSCSWKKTEKHKSHFRKYQAVAL